MSTSRKPSDTSEPADPLTVDRAGHIGPEFDEIEAMCRRAMTSAAAMSYLAHYTGNVFDFGFDTLGEPLGPPDRPPGTTGRDELRRVGRALSFALARLDSELLEARTGALIRVVVHTSTGAALCNAVVPGESVVGFVLESDSAENGPELLSNIAGQRSTDVAMADLVTEIRQRVSLPSSNPGGYRTSGPARSSESAVHPHVHLTRFDGMDTEAERVLAACTEAIHPTTLYLVAYCRGGEITFMADCFGHPSLLPFFRQITADARRKFYLAHAREIGVLATTLGRTVHTALGGGRVLRMVLDVEQGAIYYYRLRAGDYLVGITIDQSSVSQADDRMAELTRTVMSLRN